MTTYLGIKVLDTTEPDRGDGTPERFERKAFELNTQTGPRGLDFPGPETPVREFSWTCFSRAEVKVLLDFVDEVRGRAGRFWLLSYERAFTLEADHSAGTFVLGVFNTGYSAHVFPEAKHRKRIAIRNDAPGSGYEFRGVRGVSESGDGSLEFLTLDVPLAADKKAPGLVSFLRLCRLEVDEVRVEWSGGHFARCQLPIREVPHDVPDTVSLLAEP